VLEDKQRKMAEEAGSGNSPGSTDSLGRGMGDFWPSDRKMKVVR
jgi:hypothetical protein